MASVSPVERIGKICATLPECVVEGDQHHKITVRGKTIGYHTVNHHGDGRVALWVKAARGENIALVASDPLQFFMPAYVAQHGYVGIYLDVGPLALSTRRLGQSAQQVVGGE